MHFTRMGALRGRPRAAGSSCAARAATSTTSTASATSTACRRCSASTPATGAPSSARPPRAGQGARLLHELELRPPARDRAGRAHRRSRARQPEPRLLHLGRLGGGRVRDEALARLPPLRGEARATSSIAREIAYHGTTMGALIADRRSRDAHPVRAADARAAATSRTPTATAGRRTATRCWAPTRSRSGSSSRARRPSPP